MAQITDYASLSAAINSWDERSHDVDELIGLAEAEFRLYFGPSFTKESSAALTFTAGSSALPAGFIRPLGLTHSVYGGLTQAAIAVVRDRRIFVATGIPDIYAVTGATIEVGPSYDGALQLDFEGTLVGLTSVNTTNWLITNAPQAYLSMCLSVAKAKWEDFQNASIYKAQSMQTLYDLGIQSMVAQQGRASVTIPGATP